MCLTIKGSIIPRVATRDIIVYKLFDIFALRRGGLVSPIIGHDFGRYYKGKIIKPSRLKFYDIKSIIKRHEVGGGFIHCYLNPYPNMVKCKIPKGTLYYIDKYGDEVCAGKLEIVEFDFNELSWMD